MPACNDVGSSDKSTFAAQPTSSRLAHSVRIAVPALLVLHAVLLAWGAYRHSPTFDEVAYLPAGVSHWELGRFDLASVSPPLVRLVAAIPVILADARTEWRSYDTSPSPRAAHAVGRDFATVNGERTFWFFTIARWACIPFSLIGGYVCWAWGRDLYGMSAGLLALILWCFSPNILAHAQLVTPDVGTTALGAASAYTFWRWLKEPDWSRAAVAGLALGLAQLTKSTLVIFFVLWPLLWLVDRLVRKHPLPWAEVAQLILASLLGVYLLNLGYGFQGSLNRLDSYQFVSRTLAGDSVDDAGSGNRFAELGFRFVPVPLPRNYLQGIDYQKKELENRGQHERSYLRGEWQNQGWWYYYLYAMAIKVPIGTWLLAGLACVVRLRMRERRPCWIDELVLVVPMLAILVLVSSQTGFNHHMRYVLPIFPFIFIWISQAARAFLFAAQKWTIAVSLAGALSVGSSLWVYPHSLSYFNEFVGGPLGGHTHLIDSNIDWGQDLLYLRDWIREHPEAQPMQITYFGNISPETAGIEVEKPPGGGPTDEGGTDFAVRPPKGETPCDYGPQPGWFAISVNYLRGVTWNVGVDYRYFQRFEPVGRAGYSIMIYHITLEEANAVRRELGLPLLPDCRSKQKTVSALRPRR